MKDEEIVQLGQLKEDRDNLLKTSYAINSLNKKNDIDHIEEKWKHNIVGFFKSKKEEMIRGGDWDNRDEFRFKGTDFRNDIIREKVRDIQGKVLKLLENEIDILIEDVTEALENYSGQEIKVYFREKIKALEYRQK